MALIKAGADVSVKDKEDGSAVRIIDGNDNTYWHSKYSFGEDTLPYTFTIQFPTELEFNAIRIRHRKDPYGFGCPQMIEFRKK